ncbi:MAG TPA: ParM/StbA family protein, partial [Phototrophicaceae bacterium]|nr:ParM/StbA family protein [Phototrophicaceae bacterium]
MADYIASVDAGNGGTNAILAKPDGGYKAHYEPSVRAAATGATLGLDKDQEMQYDYVDWNGHRYVTGDDVVRVTRRNLERHMGGNRYGNEFHQFLVAVALAKLGVKEGKVDLTLFAPPGLFTTVKQTIIDRFMEEKGKVQIKLKSDKTARSWTYERVRVMPEGLGAVSCFLFDDQGELQDDSILAGEVVVMDSGAFTLDALKMQDGNFNPESLEHATWENGGVDVHIRQPILRVLKQKSEDFANTTVDDVDRVIRLGTVTGDYVLRAGGVEVNLKPLLDKHCERYAEWIANNILDGVFNGLRGIKSLILVGGG